MLDVCVRVCVCVCVYWPIHKYISASWLFHDVPLVFQSSSISFGIASYFSFDFLILIFFFHRSAENLLLPRRLIDGPGWLYPVSLPSHPIHLRLFSFAYFPFFIQKIDRPLSSFVLRRRSLQRRRRRR